MKYKLSDICIGITDGSHNPPTGGGKSEFLMLSSKNVFDNQITFEEPRYLSKEQFAVEHKRTNITPGDVLMTIVGTVGRTAVVAESTPPITLQRSVVVLHPKDDVCSSRYLMYLLRSKRAFFEAEAHGVAQKGIYLKQLSDVRVDVPEIESQREIVQILDKVQGVIQKRHSEVHALDDLIKARFAEMFGDPISNEKGWHTASLTEVCSKIYGGGTPSKSHPEYFEGSIPWVSPKDMKADVITDSIDHITEEAICNSTTNLVPEGSVLMVIRSGILKHDLPVAINAVPVTINQDMKAFVPSESITASFLRNYFKAIEPDVLAGVRGVTADNIDFKSFQLRKIIVPPIYLQIAFEDFCKQVDKSKVAVQAALDKAQLLFDSLMQQYFG